MNSAIIVDMDGTLANLDHRRHFVMREKKDWLSFYMNMDKDTPRPGLRTIINLLSQHVRIIIFSARPQKYEKITRDWLRQHGIIYHELHLRWDTNMEDSNVKKKMLEQYKRVNTGIRIIGVFDDRQRVVDMWRSQGLECYQVDKWEEYKGEPK